MTTDCVYCGHEFHPAAAEDDQLVCAASGESYCGMCRPDHVGSCGACAFEIYEAE
jgi:hypothetical protein